MRLSPKALGVLLEVSVYGAPRGVKGLCEAFGVGRDQINSALAELASMRLIALSNGKTSKGTYWHKIELTTEGKVYSHDWLTGNRPLRVFPIGETPTSISLNSSMADTYKADIPYSQEQYGLYANSVNQGVKTSFHALEKKKTKGKNMGLGELPLDPDDLEAELEKDAKRKAEERNEQSRDYYKKRQIARSKKTPDRWTPTDMVNYFAERCKTIWQVEQVALTQRPRLVKAMYQFRVDNNTNGEIDKRLLDMFISSYRFEHRKLYNPEQLFWTFLNYAPSKIDEVRRAMKPEDLDVVSAAREKARAEREEYLRSIGR